MNNYRGISLMSVAAKVYNKVLLYRIRDPIDKILRTNQAGFRQGRGCAEQVHILRRLIEGAIDKNLDIYAVFVDFVIYGTVNSTNYLKMLKSFFGPRF
jgi:hypothetical protein